MSASGIPDQLARSLVTHSGHSFLALRFEGGHVDGETVLHIGFEQPVVSFVDLLDGDDFHIGGDVCSPQKPLSRFLKWEISRAKDREPLIPLI
jgi:hypothetical protein